MKKIFNIIYAMLVICGLASCDSFLDEHTPQGTLSDDQVKAAENAEAMAVSAYAIFTTAEDINSSFSMWNFDVRSDDTNWNINDMWVRLYNSLSRVNSAISLLNSCDESFSMKQQRLAEMKFLRAYGHFLLKRLYKNIPFVENENLTYEEYNTLSNRTYSNDEGWQLIIDDLMEAYNTLPQAQVDWRRLLSLPILHSIPTMAWRVISITTSVLRNSMRMVLRACGLSSILATTVLHMVT